MQIEAWISIISDFLSCLLVRFQGLDASNIIRQWSSGQQVKILDVDHGGLHSCCAALGNQSTMLLIL